MRWKCQRRILENLALNDHIICFASPDLQSFTRGNQPLCVVPLLLVLALPFMIRIASGAIALLSRASSVRSARSSRITVVPA
jgi:hypothetical protein